MRRGGPLPRLHAITDERTARRPDLEDIARELATGGGGGGGGAGLALHARGRNLTGLEHYDLATRLSVSPSTRLFVNDRLDVALATAAHGVELRTDSLSPTDARRLDAQWWIGVSVHNLAEAQAAHTAGADYLLVGPAFATATHPERAPLGLARLTEIVSGAGGLPVIAIGGVTPERVAELKRAGVYGVAAIRALWDAADPAASARRMAQELDEQ